MTPPTVADELGWARPAGPDPEPAAGADGRPPGGSYPRPPDWTRPAFAVPTRWIAVIVLVIAVVIDVARLLPIASLGSVVLVVVAVGGLLLSGRVHNRQALVLGFAAVLVAAMLALRTSPWLVPLDVVAALGLAVLTAGYAGGGSVLSSAGTSLARQAGRAVVALCLAPAFAVGCATAWIPARTPDRRRHLLAVGRGLGLAIPVVVVLAILLASADAVFASLFSIPFDLGSVAGHVAFVGIGIIVGATILVDASLPAFRDRTVTATPLGATETVVVLASVTALYGAFAATQVVAAGRGADHVLETAGLTYADHARQGFFQLLAVAVLTLVVVCGLRAATRFESGRQRLVVALFGEAVVALTLVIVGVALQRLDLYEVAFGSTMLRLACTVFAWWLGAVFALVALWLAGLGRNRRWLSAAVVTSAFVALVGWNVVNPEQVVVDRNLDHYRRSGQMDTEYLWHLSDDAVPAMAALLPVLDPGSDERAEVLARVCLVPAPPAGSQDPALSVRPGSGIEWRGGPLVLGAGAPGGPQAPTGLGANRSATLAAGTRAEVCGR